MCLLHSGTECVTIAYMSNAPTTKQIDLITTLSRKAGFDWPGAAAAAAGLTDKRGGEPDVRYDITRADASMLIDELKDGLSPTIDASDVIAQALDVLRDYDGDDTRIAAAIAALTERTA